MNKNSNKSKYLLIGLGVTSVLAGGYFAVKWYKGNKQKSTENNVMDFNENPRIDTKFIEKNKESFPMRNGSTGDMVRQLQNALIRRYGSSILPKYGADGVWGSELTAAMRSKSFPTVLDFKNFLKIVSSNELPSAETEQSNSDVKEISSKLYRAVISRSTALIVQALSKIRNVEHYNQVNAHFKMMRVFGVRQTVVHASLAVLPSSSHKEAVKKQLSRIGLRYDGVRWHLSGIELPYVVSTQRTDLFDEARETVWVPQGTIIGQEIHQRNGISTIRTMDDYIVFARSIHLSYQQ